MTPDARIFFDRHAGETCLIVCNGPSLNSLPLDLLRRYPSIGCNTIVEWQAFKPTYYVAVDDRVRREFGDRVLERFGDIPKFIPTPNLDKWQGPLFYNWFHRPGELWPWREKAPRHATMLTDPGITWYCCPHAMLQIAYFMGFKRMLVVGMDHSANRKEHAWGVDEGMTGPTDSGGWWDFVESGHAKLMEGFAYDDFEILNITPGTHERVFPKGDWQDW